MRRAAWFFVAVVSILILAGWSVACSRPESEPAAGEPAAAGTPVPSETASAAEPSAVDPAEQEAIRQALRQYVEAERGAEVAEELRIVQIAVDSDYSLVSWIRGENGGQAILRKEGGDWKVLRRDRGWYGLKGLIGHDVPEQVAKRLLDEIDPSWAEYESSL